MCALLASASLTVPAFAQQVNLAWDPVDDPQIDHYKVYIGTSPGAHDVLVQNASEAKYVFSASAGVLYYFAVSSVNKSGLESALSPEITGAIPKLTAQSDRTSSVGVPIAPLFMFADDPDGGTLQFSHTGLPLGLSLDSSTGQIGGTPTSTGTFNVTIFVSDGVLSSSQSFQWTIQSAGSSDLTAPSLSITSHTSGQAVSANITLSGTATDSGLGDSGIRSVRVNGQLATGGTASGSGVANWSRSLTISSATNNVLVEAQDGAGNYSAQIITLTRDVMAPTVSITNYTSGQVINTSNITLQGTATDNGKGSTGITSVTVNGGAATGGLASTTDVATWSRSLTLAPGTNTITVVARDGAGNQATSQVTIVLGVTSVSLTPNLSSPRLTGTAVAFTASASGGGTPRQYKFLVQRAGGAAQVVRNWSTSGSYTWTPSTADSYTVSVWARSAGATADVAESSAQVPYVITAPLTITGLTPDRASPQTPGTMVTFTAGATGGSAPYQFKWWLFDGTTWTMVRDWTTSATYAWTPVAANPNYRVGIWVRSAGTTADVSNVNLSVAFPVSGQSSNPLTITGLTSDLASPQATGTSVTFTATAAGGNGPYQYKWWVFDGTNWAVARDWGAATYTWRPSTANVYYVGVWARSATTTTDSAEAYVSVRYVVNGSGGGPLTVGNISTSVAIARVGFPVTAIATASGGTGPYEFKWWVFNGATWTVVRDWGTAVYTFTPTAANANVRIGVWVRSAGSSDESGSVNLSIPLPISP